MKHLLWILLLGFQSSAEAQRLAIMQGLTTESSTEFVILAPESENFDFRLRSKQGTEYQASLVRQHFNDPSQWKIYYVSFLNLPWSAHFDFQVLKGSETIDLRRARLLPLSLFAPNILVASCMKDTLDADRQDPMWDAVEKQKPDIAFFVGDNVYAARNTALDPHEMWEKYARARNRIKFFRQKELTPTLAIWDDHDYGLNDGDETYPHKTAMWDVLRVFFPQTVTPNVLERGPGASFLFRAFGQDFYFMDGRSFRSPKKTNNPTLWGPDLEKWLLQNLSSSRQPGWIINGTQIFGKLSVSENYEEDQKESFKSMMAELKKIPRPLGFITGDRHHSELAKIPSSFLGYTTFEVTSSAMHANKQDFHLPLPPNPRRIAGTFRDNFVILSPRAGSQILSVHMEGRGKNNKRYFQEYFQIRK